MAALSVAVRFDVGGELTSHHPSGGTRGVAGDPSPILLAFCTSLGFQNLPESPGTRRAVPLRVMTAR
jgi:hypothetical protein